MASMVMVLSPLLMAAAVQGSAVGRGCIAGCDSDSQYHCQTCADQPIWSCKTCCPNCVAKQFDGGVVCSCASPPPGPPPPGPPPPQPGGTYLCKNGQCYEGYGTETKATCEATCKPGPSPPGPPGPPPGGDSWQQYWVAGMQVLSVTGGKDPHAYDKVVVLLHGGGGSGDDWRYQYSAGWFGNLTGMKYVFPTSAIPSHVWYISFKNGCGFVGDCAYNISSIHDSAERISTLIEHERGLLGGDASKVYLAGFSEGAQMTSYMQISKLDYALGGVIVMDGYPLPPLCDMPGHLPAAAKRNASYTGQDMKWMIWHGEEDPIFPCQMTITAYNDIFRLLGVSSTLKIEHTEPGMTHTIIKPEFDQMVQFIRGG